MNNNKQEIFRGTIILESLGDFNILKNCKIISTEISEVTDKHQTPWLTQWTKHKVEVSGIQNAREFAEKISKSFDNHNGSWYADYNDGKTIFIIFPNKIFEFDGQNKAKIEEAKKYGISIGIPEYQVDFKKLRVL